ncbi:MAG TPA: AAA family ATPase [Trebonia sp.]|nr:AAA family ATPase [Trebonia sp.]
MAGEPVAELVRARLAASGLGDGAQRLALSAVAGEAALNQALESGANPEVDAAPELVTPGNVWLRSITVRGFRGVGPASRLEIEPGPGLTLLVGRNGSGKSSFAEGVEVALTGKNERLQGKTADWHKQWRNIHDGAAAFVEAEFQVDGDPRILAVQRSWSGKNIADASSQTSWSDGQQCDLPGLGWSGALEQYRPFLSYDDLGKVSDRPSVVFDLIAGVLGLGSVATAQELLTGACSELGKIITQPGEALPPLLETLRGMDDERARRVAGALSSDPPGANEAAKVLGEAPEAGGSDPRLAALTRLASLPALDPEAAAAASQALRSAAASVEAFKGTDTEEAGRLADLLDTALSHHASHGDGLCPVCGQGALDGEWRQRTAEEVRRLRTRSAAASAARNQLRQAVATARNLLQPVPAPLSGTGPDGVDRSRAASTWHAWAQLAGEEDPLALSEGLMKVAPVLIESVSAVRAAATGLVQQMENMWRPASVKVQAWLDLWEQAGGARTDHADLTTALNWIKSQAEELRRERLAPFSEQSAQIWADLRQDSNVDLGPIAFTGGGRTRRKLEVSVRIDGADGGVPMLSNGELHALGLSLFLPRSTAPDSPFRFVIIDDPVQAMDPSKVEGLARVLHQTAAARQVVVLTHDDRLPDALRRLMLPATILEVTRREGSLVEIVPSQDPVHRYLDDARQIARTAALPDDLAAVAATGSCRDAVEAACQRAARRQLHAQGVPLAEIDRRLINAHTTMHKTALALFGDSRQSAQVMPSLNRLAGAPWAADVLRAVREGTHQPRSDLDRIISNSERLCDLILSNAQRTIPRAGR